ncbi:NAD-dependent DNA ligase LigA [bacterium]|uniref:NAD-dependent DNA ligase LigA n=1 Tax=Lachnospiraceae TaxID=186803 RepID=UPI002A2AC5AE|nr:NAD-dependent DNA ligase LigA [bacterium]MDY2886482.1 NAD-dependent DNA ligase LigA [Bariatricus sp.]MCI7148614.1 NAD-dependent DNA ligase LigA [bacterium]MDD6513949.1 NAD-dependent DNA ligase LigA [bacterium]MDY4194382.1 NAD-dependent DNA ligase LigA [Bariatricus sp.]
MDKKKRMQELVELLNRAGKAYYQESREIMSNFEYDALYDELKGLEEELGIVLASSPTIHVGYEVLSELPKERHESPMLSLDKTKEVSRLKEFVGNQKAVISWKMDGLTIVLTYRGGTLYKAVTRGNGEIGEVITNNARVFKNIPLHISYKGELILRGEAVIGYRDFERINETIEDVDAKYKNPRNLCSGSVRQLNNEITAKRNVKFYAFTLVKAEGVDFHNSRAYQLDWLADQGFEVVEHYPVTADELEERVAYFAEKIKENDFPSDGLVLVYDDIAYGQSLGRTAKFPRDSFAFKWADEIKETHLLEIEWSPSRTGLINPVAIFEPVELEGTTVSRASVHNLSIMEELELGIGDTIEVYKANMIIPQIARNLTRSGRIEIPRTCPVCGGETRVRQMNDAKSLYCTNPECQAKRIKAFALLTSRDALNVEGLSEATLEKFIARGFIHKYTDIFHLDRYQEEIQSMEGFGEKSYANLIQSIEKARETTLPKVIYSLGIAGVGLANAKLICRESDYDVTKLMNATEEELSEIAGVGPVIAKAFTEYFSSEEKKQAFLELMQELKIQEEPRNEEQQFAGMNFVITGSVNHFANRNEVKELIEQRGGKVTGSVTGKTNYLINNDVNSTSSKNKKARELKVPIISEEEFMKLAGL